MPTEISTAYQAICEVQSMVSGSLIWKRTQQVTLSLPMQASLLTGLCMLSLWTFYFSTYPPAHDAVHTTRHNTLAVACH
ncbi:MAG: CbtB-domain containing protein [Oculatellaceae cyanobacterium bins.114]|nr:CbtB-domain containing protein [Oculatellaceae cyanobacterium bins.114]